MLDQESLHLLISCQLPIVLYHQTYKLSGKEHSRSEFIQVWITWHGNSVPFLLTSSQLPLFTPLWKRKGATDVSAIVSRPSQAASSADSPRRLLGSVSFTILHQFLQVWLPLWAVRFLCPFPPSGQWTGRFTGEWTVCSLRTGHLVPLNLRCASQAPGLLSVVKGTGHAGV